ncbi:TetR family transcriptional regulator [Flexivirga endophytica]|uniref:TetR family transcriptional regulator n=1 Tax=Flexivirga endophytica TaxID=1849103 RepID=A0A916TCF7_9MICO|nr:TetR family transcriptional regulator C-terminal domain-containing protein [Flexivirga endophytica]GGB40024.1 TetR family transcriptional regulator [Flexivirga endophytica]GHB47912.1 TetR family transcriptional regulator [Flexivirga endophytica]
MGRPKGNHEDRRGDVAEAVWLVLATDGFNGLTIRAIARQLQATTGVVTHYFGSKREIIGYALELLEKRSAGRPRRAAADGLAALRAAIMDMLPLDGKSTTANRVWVSSWDHAIADPQFRREHARRYAAGVERLTGLVEMAQELGELAAGDARSMATQLQSFALGVIVQAVLDPAQYSATCQIALLDDHLARLARTPEIC